MSEAIFTQLGEVQKKKKDPTKFHIKLSRKVIIEAGEERYTNKDGKEVVKKLPKIELEAGSYVQLLDPNRGKTQKPDFIKYDLVHIENDK